MPERRSALPRDPEPRLSCVVAYDPAGLDFRLAREFTNWRTSPLPAQRRLSSRQASFLFVKRPEGLSPTQQRYLEQICQASNQMKQVYKLSQQFLSMVRQRQAESLDEWLKRVKEHGPGELISFASGIRRDYAAVQAGLSKQESNGQVEGQITRLKYLKRQMYGRAKFDLLRLRVLHAA
jgi:transposase